MKCLLQYDIEVDDEDHTKCSSKCPHIVFNYPDSVKSLRYLDVFCQHTKKTLTATKDGDRFKINRAQDCVKNEV